MKNNDNFIDIDIDFDLDRAVPYIQIQDIENELYNNQTASEEKLKELKNNLKKMFLDEIDILKDFNQISYNYRYVLNYFDRANLIYGYMHNKYGLTFEEIKIIDNITKAYYKRLKRCRDYIKFMFGCGDVYFLTLTFRDDILNNTKESTRRTYVQRFLNKYFYYYCANIDYGEKNEREHYHAIACVPWWLEIKNTREYVKNALVNDWLAVAGGNRFEKTGKKTKDFKKLSSYINKFTNHAFKKTTKGKRLIYSRNICYMYPLILIENDKKNDRS